MHLVDPAAPSGSASAFPRSLVHVGAVGRGRRHRAHRARRAGAGDPPAGDEPTPAPLPALVVPVTELEVEDDAHLAYANLQVLDQACTQLAVQASRVGRNATLRSFTVSLGGGYARVRTDSDLVGQGGHTSLLAAYLGTDDQVHDFRTLQDHHAPRTESELLFKGAVADDGPVGLQRPDPHPQRRPRGATPSRRTTTSCCPRGPMPTRCPTSTSRRTTCAAATPRRWAPSTRSSATTWSPGGSARPWPNGSSCSASSRTSPAGPRSPAWARGWTEAVQPPAGGPPAVRVTRDGRDGPMGEVVRLCGRDELASGTARRFEVGAHRIALVRIEDDFYAIGDTCSHEDYSLSEGEVLVEECEIECWKHGSTFDLRTGEPQIAAGHQAGPRVRGARRRRRRDGGAPVTAAGVDGGTGTSSWCRACGPA